METPDVRPDLPDGVRPLPVLAGQLALNFANTVDDPGGHEEFDHLGSYHALLGWTRRVEVLSREQALRLAGVAEQHPRQAAQVLHRAHALRDALNATFGALTQGGSPADGWTQLRPFVEHAVHSATLVSTSVPPVPTWPFDVLESPLWPVSEAAYRLLGAPELRRLKRCAGCPWLFLDSSRNGSRRWCAMEDCGTHEKIRRYVTKRAERRPVRP